LLPRNYLFHVIEGSLFMGGLTFVNADTVLPVLLESLGAPAWVISFAPSLMFIGLILPPLLTVHVVERLDRMLPFVRLMGVFQRLPYLGAALALFFLAERHPVATVVIVASAPLLSGLLGGVGIAAWMELVSRIIPTRRLSSASALRFAAMGGIGILAGVVIKEVLQRWPGTRGYGLLHLIAFGFLVLSYLTFFLIREPVAPVRKTGTGLGFRATMRSLPDLLGKDVQFRRLLLARMSGIGVFILLPFLPIHVLHVTGREAEFIGTLVLSQMIGTFTGNLAAGYLGDRHGGRAAMLLSSLVLLLACLAVLVNRWEAGFYLVYFLLGFSVFAANVGFMTLNIELSPTDRRPTYLALAAASSLPAFVASGILAAANRRFFHRLEPAAVLVALLAVASCYFLLRLRVERRADP
jgi:MFS family permease